MSKNICITIDTEKDSDGSYKKMLSGLQNAEELFDKYKIKPTLFVTCDCIENHAAFFSRLKRKGWEIALHGYRHKRFDEMSDREKEEDIRKAEKCFSKYLKEKPKGMRAPQFSADFSLIRLLDDRRFVYDSSKVQFPLSQIIFFRKKLGLYLNQIGFERKIKSEKMKIKEIPVSSFILPISMFTLSKLPFWLFKTLSNLSLIFRRDNNLIFLSHSYEFDDSRVMKLERFILSNKDCKFKKMIEIVEERR